tara:strand:+ start:601 stop:882 length:282 start_codon:yes stop_codon:yes gene_type:complete
MALPIYEAGPRCNCVLAEAINRADVSGAVHTVITVLLARALRRGDDLLTIGLFFGDVAKDHISPRHLLDVRPLIREHIGGHLLARVLTSQALL